MSNILPSEIELLDIREMIFRHEGTEYFLLLSGSELKREIAYEIGIIEDEDIEYTTYIGSPYRGFKRAATADDVSEYHIKNWIAKNPDKWKTN